MTKVFKSSSISKILSTNQLNTIEVNNDNIRRISNESESNSTSLEDINWTI